MRPNDLSEDGKVEVGNQFSPTTGMMYAPSCAWGVFCLIDWDDKTPCVSEAWYSLVEALNRAQRWMEGGNGDRSAIVFRRKDGKISKIFEPANPPTCRHCQGEGRIPDPEAPEASEDGKMPCPTCEGDGVVTDV